MGFWSTRRSEAQSALAGGVGQRLDAAVIEIAGAVEHDARHAGCARALGDQAPDLLRGVDVAAALQLVPHVLFEGRGGRQRRTALIVDDLRVDLLRRAEHRKPRTAVRRLTDRTPNPRLAAVFGSKFLSHSRGPYFFLPSLRKMNSSAYFTPLPL